MMAGMPQDVQDALAASVPFPPRLGRAEEYAALVKHICENTMLNGEVIRLDGALRNGAPVSMAMREVRMNKQDPVVIVGRPEPRLAVSKVS